MSLLTFDLICGFGIGIFATITWQYFTAPTEEKPVEQTVERILPTTVDWTDR